MTDRHLAIIDTSSSPAALCRARSLHSGLPCRRNIPFSPVKKSSPYCFQHRKRARFNMRWDWNGDRADGFSSDSSGGSDAWEDCHETWSELAEEDTVGREATHLIGGAKTLSGMSDAGSTATGLICEGINQLTGERCLRRVRKERLCHHHLREEARMKDKAVYNLDVLDHTLSSITKHRLRMELQKPLSASEEAGFIYAYELQAKDGRASSGTETMYKIGRAINVYRRLLQWSSQCGYTPRLIEFFPIQNIPSPDNAHAHHFTPKRCKYTHRAERLIHIELAERYGAGPVVCHGGCREAHYELFRARRRDGGGDLLGAGEGVAWEEIRKVIVKWVEFVDSAYDEKKGAVDSEDEVSRFVTPDPDDVKSEDGEYEWYMEDEADHFDAITHETRTVDFVLKDRIPCCSTKVNMNGELSLSAGITSKFDRADDEDMIFDDIVLGIPAVRERRIEWESIVPRGQ